MKLKKLKLQTSSSILSFEIECHCKTKTLTLEWTPTIWTIVYRFHSNDRSECPAEIIRYVLFGYFSKKTGLLVHMEDSHLTRIQSNGGDTVYWETTLNSHLHDYQPVESIMIAHFGRSVITLFRFEEVAMSHTKT
ncbi:hypothetical protein V6N13_127044 [Hibiscus sabdariffa]|uniref:Uncharacterized protein n=1 Tax=Hibiscus sabdariffa TaxID=183260 RepID=A0ABR2RE75_9ROSI